MDKIVSNTLKDLGVTPALLGYDYLRDAIKLAMDDPFILHRITKEMYPRIAQHYDTKPSRVERCIRHAIEHAWGSPDNDLRADIFRGTVRASKGKPTNSEFIASIVDYLRIRRYK